MAALRSLAFTAAAAACQAAAPAHRNELLPREQAEALGVVWRGNASEDSSHEKLTVSIGEMPADFTWCDKDGVNYCTMSRNEHIPQYCGSCWAHAAVSALADRVKIARKAKGIDINPSVQHLLNCGGVGSCAGGTVDRPYQACSPESTYGFCPHVDTTCKPLNVARTCGSFGVEGGPCTGLSSYPNVSISDYGSISGADAMMKEIYTRGPISCGISLDSLLNYEE